MQVLVRINNVYSYLEGSYSFKAIEDALSFYVSGFFMSKLFRLCPNFKCARKINPKTGRCVACNTPRAWDGRKKLLLGGKTKAAYFPTGCLPLVVKVLERFGIPIIYRDERIRPESPVPEAAYQLVLNERELWKEQQDAIFSALTYGRGTIQVPTGGGKSSILAGLSKLLNYRTVVLINNQSIAKQLQNEIGGLIDEPVGLIKGGQFTPERVTIAMTQSLINAYDAKDPDALYIIKETKLLMLDEGHHTSSNTWFNLCKSFNNAYYRFAVTGTAFMRPAGDDLLLIGAIGGLIYEVAEESLIKQGKLALPIIHFYKIDSQQTQTNFLEQKNNKKLIIEDEPTYGEVYKNNIVNNIILNQTCAHIIKNLHSEAQILVLFEQLEHVENVAVLLNSKIKFEILTGDSTLEHREQIKEQFVKGDVNVILATKIFDEGVSINNIDIVIRMGLMKTKIKSKQQVGRGQRIKKDKDNIVRIVDFLHISNKYLAEHSLHHYEMYEHLNYPIIVDNHVPKNLSEWEAEEKEHKRAHPELWPVVDE